MAVESEAARHARVVVIAGGAVVARRHASGLGAALEVLGHRIEAAGDRAGPGPWLARVESGGRVYEQEIRLRPGGRGA